MRPNLLPEVSVFPEGHQVSVGVWDMSKVLLLGYRNAFTRSDCYSIGFNRSARLKSGKGRAVVNTDDYVKGEVAPFSFFKWIFVSPSLYNRMIYKKLSLTNRLMRNSIIRWT